MATKFENWLINKRYKRLSFDWKTHRYNPVKTTCQSTMADLHYNYVHENEDVVIEKMLRGDKVTKEDFKSDKVNQVIRVGLNEQYMPIMISYPRPVILNKEECVINYTKEQESNYMMIAPTGTVYKVNGYLGQDYSCYDKMMSRVESQYEPKEILEAMFDRSKVLLV